jgi:ABC-type transport system substrate-binding protein
MSSRWLGLTFVAVVLAAGAPSAGAQGAPGGILRVKLTADVRLDFATTFDPTAWGIAYATCANLMTFPDRSGEAGARPQPEAAAAYPTVSRHGKTYTFRVRRGLRFSDSTRISAANFAAAINRDLDPAMNPDPTTPSAGGTFLTDVVGAKAVTEGKASHASGVTAHGNRLVIRLLQPHPDLVSRLGMPFFCPIPVDLPHDPLAVDHLPGSGPYYVASHVPNEQIVLKRNPFYNGLRPHRPSEIVFTIGGDSGQNFREVQQGLQDVITTPLQQVLPDSELRQLAHEYQLNRSRLYSVPQLITRSLSLNASRPLFRNNPDLRRAVNYAIDRPLLAGTYGYLNAAPTAGLLPPSVAGFRPAGTYPLRHPDLKKARALARGHLRSGTAVMYTGDAQPAQLRAHIVQHELAAIGLKVVIKSFAPQTYFTMITARGARFDIADSGWQADYPDPGDFVQSLVDGRHFSASTNGNTSYFDNHSYDRRIEAAARLAGAARFRAFGRLDVGIMRKSAPYAPYMNSTGVYFVSNRVGCIVKQPYFVQDYAAFCLKR